MKTVILLFVLVLNVYANNIVIINPKQVFFSRHEFRIYSKHGIKYEIVNLFEKKPFVSAEDSNNKPIKISSCADLKKYDFTKLKKVASSDRHWLIQEKRSCDIRNNINLKQLESISFYINVKKFKQSTEYLQMRKSQMEQILNYIKEHDSLKNLRCDEEINKNYLGCQLEGKKFTHIINNVLQINKNKFVTIYERFYSGSNLREFWLFIFENKKIIDAKKYN